VNAIEDQPGSHPVPLTVDQPTAVVGEQVFDTAGKIDLWGTRPSVPSSTKRAIDRLFDEAFAPFYSARGTQSGGQPGPHTLPVTIWERGEAFHMALLAPGMDENSIDVTVQDDTLSVAGELKFQPPEDALITWQEFGPLRFRRSLHLGTSVDANRVLAVYRNGLLLITMPKVKDGEPRAVRTEPSAVENEGPSREVSRPEQTERPR
jgi:HSP20 family protein